MNLAEILSNPELRQREFPVVRDTIYLAHAGVSPLPRRAVEAIQGYVAQCDRGDQEDYFPLSQIQRTRELGARLIGVTPEEVALVGPTTLGLNMVASGLKWRKGDNMLVYFDDYPSNVYPWMALAAKGVKVRLLNIKELGRIRLLDIMGQVDENTRLVALASNHFLAGYRIDIPAIGQFLHSRNILFCVDGIQTLGAFPTPGAHVDFMAADAHKWMLGPCAAGLFYVRKAAQAQLEPPIFGWHNVLCPNYVVQEQMQFPPDARRYEAGTDNLLGMVGMQASLELLLEVGVDAIAAELLRKRAWMIPALQAKGWEVLQAEAPAANASAILSITREEVDLRALHGRLRAARIIVSLRGDRAGKRYLRLAPHFYNTDEELHRVLEML